MTPLPCPDLQSFREALAVLQRQVDGLDDLKAQHYQEIMEHEEEVWDVVQGKVRVLTFHCTFSG
jgi:hypothetical protein